jgi:transposase
VEGGARWDGLHGVVTNMKEATHTQLLERYACLWNIEEPFCLNKHTLSMRPIFHFKKECIHAHIAICYMAFAPTFNHYWLNLARPFD